MRQAITLTIVLGITFFIWWSNFIDDSDQFQSTQRKDYVDIFMNEFEMTAMNEYGRPDYTINGAHLARLANSDDSEIQQPVIQLLQENNQWKIVADNATINHKTDTIQLKNNVVMQQQNARPAVTIRTDFLMVHTDSQIAQTQAQVDITHGDSRLRSKGMVFNNITSELELTSSVKGHFSTHD